MRVKLNKQRGIETEVSEVEKKYQKYKFNFLRSAKGRRNVSAKQYPQTIHQNQLQIKKINLVTVGEKEVFRVAFGNNGLTISRDFYFVLDENSGWQIYNMER